MIIKSIREMMTGRDLASTTPSTTVREACRILTARNVGALAVLDGDRLVGMFSERDVIRKCICGDHRTDETTVADIMTPDPQAIDIDRSLADALTIMTKGGFRHLPVLSGGQVVGMISIRDVPLEYRLMHDRFNEYRTPAA
ncbi:CBS domain-containing protein [Roseospira navarrensis]|uniref:CBS domain-containing protein n=1 Tax=Roseospira navarrensis TaxID=140058 RepID=A0A7X1ZG09_9PROT|nr:CBS domain-containing protein [Roseospira navarrensis]MQX36722.1 CBS domain-containing protein [Roseospira navarrensis]